MMVTNRQEPKIEKEDYGQFGQDIYKWAGAKEYFNNTNTSFSMDELNVHQILVDNGTVHPVGGTKFLRDFPKFLGIYNNQAKVKPKMETTLVEPLVVGDIFAEQDHNFKHSGEKVTQFTFMDHTAETVETQDHNFRHAADYSSLSSN